MQKLNPEIWLHLPCFQPDGERSLCYNVTDMKFLTSFLLCLACLLSGCSSFLSQQPTQAAVARYLSGDSKAASPYERVVISAEGVVTWLDTEWKATKSDATYILLWKEGKWHLTEQSIRMDAGIQHINEYGTISEEEARSIIMAACRLAQVEEGRKGELVPPGGPAQRPLFEAMLFTCAPMGKWDSPWEWMTYESTDAHAATYRDLLSAARIVAAKYGSVLPLSGELDGWKDGDNAATSQQ